VAFLHISLSICASKSSAAHPQESLALSVVTQGELGGRPLDEALLLVESSSLVGNSAYGDGGAFSLRSAPSLTLDAAVSNHNPLPVRVVFSSSNMTANRALGSGGVLGVQAPALGAVYLVITVQDCNVTGNTAGDTVVTAGTSYFSGFGGALSLASIDKLRSFLADSSAQGAGGNNTSKSALAGVYSPDPAAVLLVRNSSFYGNLAMSSGGAVYLLNTPASVGNCSFAANVAGVLGGAIASTVEVPSGAMAGGTPASEAQGEWQP
jgi:predicted outer membrane repeat protein